MNIKITKEEFESLRYSFIADYVVGSHLYGTAKETSDKDVLVLYKPIFESDLYYPNYHQLQYDDVDNNIQFILSTEHQFYKNLFSGDSTINADVIMFTDSSQDEKKLNFCRTFNIVKAFIGFAKRDLKQINSGKNKLFHIERGLYCAECLMNYELPSIENFKEFGKASVEELKAKEENLRALCNSLFEKNDLTLFPKQPIIKPMNDLEKRIIEANNIKEFKY